MKRVFVDISWTKLADSMTPTGLEAPSKTRGKRTLFEKAQHIAQQSVTAG